MDYEVIREIFNRCSGNQMRDVFFEEISTEDPDEWMRKTEPHADTIEKEILPDGIKYRVMSKGLLSAYTLTEE